MKVREARPEERLAVRSIFDVAMLQVPDLLRLTLLVAVEDDRVLGAAAVEADGRGDPGEIHAIAVRPRRRGQGIGTALVAEAERRWTPVLAEFDERVLPFYEALDFGITPIEGAGRFRAEKPATGDAES